MLTLLALALPLANQVWIVDDSGGPGVDFTDLPTAVAAAAAGDVLLVRSGDYSQFTLTSGLTLQADHGADVTVTGFTVDGVPAGQHVVLSGLTSIALGVLSDNAGKIWIEDCRFEPPPTLGGSGQAALRVTDCADVVLVDTVGVGQNVSASASPFGAPMPTPGLRVTTSAVHLFDCAFEGGDGVVIFGFPGGLDWWSGPSAGVVFESGELYALHSTFRGGDGHGSFDAYGFGCESSDGAPGLSMLSPAYVRDCTSVGGAGGLPELFGTCPGGQDGPDYGGSPVELAGGYVSLEVPSPLRENTAFDLTVEGAPGLQAVVALATSQDAILVQPWGGGLVIEGPYFVLSPLVIPGSGSLTVNLPLGDLGPSVQSLTFYGQVAGLDSLGAFTINDATATVLLDGAF